MKPMSERKNSKNTQDNSANQPKPFYPKIKKESSLVPTVRNKPIKPRAIIDAFVKVPVVLGEAKVQLDLTTKIDFPEPVLEIKDIKKQLKLVQAVYFYQQINYF